MDVVSNTSLCGSRSHTWDDDEPTYSEWRTREQGIHSGWRTRRSKETRAGFLKVKEAARQALDDGWNWLWIDTICIDKTSSAELSEAINSMFAWYEASMVCYVYLSDVYALAKPFPERRGPGDTSRPASIRIDTSRWFTRGWTLQELIAPSSLAFFSREWVLVGHFRKSQARSDSSRAVNPNTPTAPDAADGMPGDWFVQKIASITRIPLEYLIYERRYLKASVARRMSWAASRRTTRVEDMAYCLLGIFDINMPLLYGEGNRAFIRLQEEIMKVSTDQSIFAWDCMNVTIPRRQGDISIIAPSPSVFSNGGDIVLCRTSSDSIDNTIFRQSNFGLSLQLPLFDPPHARYSVPRDDYVLCMLNCRLETQDPDGRLYLPLRRIFNVGEDVSYERCPRPSACLPICLGKDEKNIIPQINSINVPRIRDDDHNSLWSEKRRCWKEHNAHSWTLVVLFRGKGNFTLDVNRWAFSGWDASDLLQDPSDDCTDCNSGKLARYWKSTSDDEFEYFSAMLRISSTREMRILRVDVRRPRSLTRRGVGDIGGKAEAGGRPRISSRVTILPPEHTGQPLDGLFDLPEPTAPFATSGAFTTSGAFALSEFWVAAVEPELKSDAEEVVIPVRIGMALSYEEQKRMLDTVHHVGGYLERYERVCRFLRN